MLTVGTFNLNNLFDRWNFEGALDALESGATVPATFVFSSEHRRKLQLDARGKLLVAKPPEDTNRIAERLLEANADLWIVQEVENADALRQFNREHLGGAYQHVMVIDGNDSTRFIDVGVLSKRPLGGVTSWQRTFHPDDPGRPVFSRAPGPEARYESREAISLAFVTAVQLLPPNQRAVLLLRDVLGYRAREVAELLGLTEDAVTSALKRARAAMAAGHSPDRPPPPAGGREERALVDRFVAAFTEQDVDALVALMTDDVWVRMPPLPFEYRGTEAVHRFFTAIDAHRRGIDRLVPVRANGQPGWGEYVRDPVTGGLHVIGVVVVGFAGDRICELTHFETTVASSFGLPRTLD